ncbi:MAG: Transporter, major facilitator family [Thermoanaerobacterales bacterium 50_218]|nr:MAG: Transporter, major facilitator family [Thermoanaerobacterales bacterium 50_218]
MTSREMVSQERNFSINWLALSILAIGGGIIYLLPYLRSTYYQTLQEALGVTNTELGLIQSVFGILTILCYFPGGWLADKVSPRILLTVSFVGTGLAGLYYATLPSFPMVVAIHVFFGLTTTLTFWAAFIKATRMCASSSAQGRAFGILEGGRGLTSTIVSFLSVGLFARFADQVVGMKAVIVLFSIVAVVIGILCWLFIKDDVTGKEDDTWNITWESVRKVLRMASVWLIALIVFLAYTTYRNADFVTPYMTKICGVSAALGALLGTIRYYGLRPVGAVAAGFLADRISSSKTMIYVFGLMCITNVLYIVFPGSPKMLYFVVANMVMLMVGCFAARGIYYALLEEGRVPVVLSGTAVGVISTIGYLADVFNPVLGGYLLDAYPGVTGFKYIFAIAAVTAAIGMLVTYWFRKSVERN